MRILAVDPGEKRIGLSISDPGGRIASPLTILTHVSREQDALAIVNIAQDNQAGLIVVGQAMDDEGRPSFHGRQAARLAGAIRKTCSIEVVLWDESGSTQAVNEVIRQGGKKTPKKRRHIDDLAAVVILQTYLDNRLS